MSDERLPAPEFTTSVSQAQPKNGRRLQTGVRTLIVLVATCAVTCWAARFLWESQHPAYGAARGLQARSPSERVNATRLLVQVGIGDNGVAIPPLIAALTDPETEVRVAACEALRPLIADAVAVGKSTDAARAAISTLIGSLNDPQPDVRIAAARVMEHIISLKGAAGVIDLERVFVAVSEMLEDQDADVRIAALGTLGSMARKLMNEPPAALRANLADESAGVRAAAIKALASFQRDLDKWIPRIFEVLEREDDPRMWNASSYALTQLRPPTYSAAALLALVKGLSSRRWELRSYASQLLAGLGRDAGPAIPNLIKTVSEPFDAAMVGPGRMLIASEDPAIPAVHALSKIAPGTSSSGEVIEALTKVVRTAHPDRRAAAANALGEFGPAAIEAVPALIDFVKQNVAIKAGFGGASAAFALGKIAANTQLADDAISSLTEALEGESEHMRQQAIEALLRFGPKATVAIPRLRKLVDDPHPWVRSAAEKALIQLGADN